VGSLRRAIKPAGQMNSGDELFVSLSKTCRGMINCLNLAHEDSRIGAGIKVIGLLSVWIFTGGEGEKGTRRVSQYEWKHREDG
jgi:hypothetical protein